MNAKSLLILLTSSLLLSGCASLNPFSGPDVKEIEVKTVAEERIRLNLDTNTVLKPRKVEWFVITPENFEEVFAKLEEKNYSVVLYGLTDDGYQNLSLNLAELRKHIMEQRAIINAYKEYYEPPLPEEE